MVLDKWRPTDPPLSDTAGASVTVSLQETCSVFHRQSTTASLLNCAFEEFKFK